MGIVVVTITGQSKLAFAGGLDAKTNGAVDLVILQRPTKVSFGERWTRAKKMLSARTFFKEARYAFLLYVFPKKRRTLAYFRETDEVPDFPKDRLPKIMEVDSINSDEVYAALKKLSPSLLVVWGSKILQPHILLTAGQAINLHIGCCPQYRGTLANQHAVLAGDFANIGATIHYIVPEVDAGDIISVVRADLSKKPRELFRDLTGRAQAAYIDIAARIYSGERIAGEKQDAKKRKDILRLDHWTPEVRYKIAARMYEWEQGRLAAGQIGACADLSL